MADTPSEILKRHQKVVAATDLPGVPAGTGGKVLVANGVTWKRYHVLFENGVQLSTLDRKVLDTRDEWTERSRPQPDDEPEPVGA